EEALNLDRALRGQEMPAAVEMRTKLDPLLVDRPQGRERHDLEPARVGQDRIGPVHKAVQSAKRRDALGAGPQHQVIGVAENEPRAGRGDPFRGHRLDGRGSADRHEHRGLDEPMRGREAPQPRCAVPRDNFEPDTGHHLSYVPASWATTGAKSSRYVSRRTEWEMPQPARRATSVAGRGWALP